MDDFKVNVPQQKVKMVSFVGNNGPVVGHAVAKALNLNGFLNSALLSELLKFLDLRNHILKLRNFTVMDISEIFQSLK